jgi:quercetin dioxygenase-like cupin family protein
LEGVHTKIYARLGAIKVIATCARIYWAAGQLKDRRRQMAEARELNQSKLLGRDGLVRDSTQLHGVMVAMGVPFLLGADMKTTHILTIAALVTGSGLALHLAQAQIPGITRTDLQRHDLSAQGREVIQVRVDFAPGVVAPNHSHPGEEIVYAIEGLMEYQFEGKPAVTLKPGQVLFIPAGTIHSVKNVGSSNAAELATYVVEKGKPLVVLAK